MPARFVSFVFAMICFLLISCQAKEKDRLYVFKSLNELIERKDKKDREQVNVVISSLVDRSTDPRFRNLAEAWATKVQVIENLSKDDHNFMKDIKTTLLREAGYTVRKDGKMDYRENDFDAVKKVMIDEGNGRQLFKRLRFLNDSILNIDTLIRKRFENNLGLFPEHFDRNSDAEQFASELFDGQPTVAALAIISQLQINLTEAEFNLAVFCHEQGSMSPRQLHMYTFPIVTQSSEVVTPGGQLEITAGVGYFQQWGVTSIRIGNNEVPLNREAYASFKMKVPRIAGKYKVPVQIKFEDQDGKPVTASKTVGYSVATE